MRSFVAALFVTAAVACSSNDATSDCSNISIVGGMNCTLTAQCSHSNAGVALDCTGGMNQCVCSMNGVTGMTVNYDSTFCGSDTSAALNAANSACGWNL